MSDDDITPGETVDQYDAADRMLDMLIADAKKLAPITTPDLAELISRCVDNALGGHTADRPDDVRLLQATCALTEAVLATAIQRLAEN
jgi:hypothetical protein